MSHVDRKIAESRENFKEASYILKNIVEGVEIERFKFTPKEVSVLNFLDELLIAHIKELED